MSDMNERKVILLVLAAVLAGCATDPPQYGEVVTMKAGEASGVAGYPPPGTVWRLEEAELKALSPAPIVEPPPPPRRAPPAVYYPPPPPPPGYYGPPY
jgi:hypothetical protein